MNKRIEEMARYMCANYDRESGICDHDCWAYREATHLHEMGYRKQSEGGLTKAHIQAHYEAIYALADMVCQFGYSTTFRKQDAVCDGGLSSLEYAFGALIDCGCKMNSNGTISFKNLWEFQDRVRERMEGEEDA